MACARGATADMATVGSFSALRTLHRDALDALTAAMKLEKAAARTAHEKEQAAALDGKGCFTTTLSFPYANSLALGMALADAVAAAATDHIGQGHPEREPDAVCLSQNHPSYTGVKMEDGSFEGKENSTGYHVRRGGLAVITCTSATHFAARVARDRNNAVVNVATESTDARVQEQLRFAEDFTPCGGKDAPSMLWASGGACGASDAAATCTTGFETRADQLYVRKYRTPNYGPHVEDGAAPGDGTNLLPLVVSGMNVKGKSLWVGGNASAPAPLACAACQNGYVARKRARIEDTYCHGAWILLPIECVPCPHPARQDFADTIFALNSLCCARQNRLDPHYCG